MPALRPLRFLGPVLLGVCIAASSAVLAADSTLADMQVALVGAGGLLFIAAGYHNPIRERLGWRPLLGLGEVSVGVAVPIGVLGTGLDSTLTALFVGVAAVAGISLVLVVGSQIAIHRS
jgi:hypothetical protein